jgi:hypothetical protein
MFLVTCCATKAGQTENNVDIVTADEDHIDESIIIEKIIADNYFAEKSDGKPFDPVDFAQYLSGGMEVVKVFHDPNIEQWIELPGKEISGRQYFGYQSPLYSKPISSTDEMFAMFNHQALIARKLNPGYTLNMDIDICNGESKELERKTLTLNVRRGITISDYRREGELRYTLKESDGSLRYGQFLVVSAIVKQNKEEAEIYHALQAWMEQPETTDFSGLFGKMLMKTDK